MVESRFQLWSIISKACGLTTKILPLLFRSLGVKSQLQSFNVSLIISLIFPTVINGNQLFTLFWPEGECSIMSWDTMDLFGSKLGQEKMCLELVYSWKEASRACKVFGIFCFAFKKIQTNWKAFPLERKEDPQWIQSKLTWCPAGQRA